AAVAAMPDGPARERALDHLYQGQSNDCYWHGLFGGIYISHMRLATYEHLIAAEDLAETANGSLEAVELRDLDMDGVDEVRLATEGQVVTVDLDGGAGIGAWDIRPVRHALTAVMRRRPEAYHEALRAHPDAPVGDLVAAPSDGPASIHDTFRVKEPGLVEHLVYDASERRSGLVRALALEASAKDWAMARATELGDAVDGAYTLVDLRPGCLVIRRDATIADARVQVIKTLTLGGNRRAPTLSLEVALDHQDGPPIEARIGVEWSMTMLGGGGNPAAWWDLRGERTAHDRAGSATDLSTIVQGNDDIGISVTTTTSAADAWWAPIETVSNSENGFERVYQGAGLLLSWPTRLEPGRRWTRTITQVIATSRDRALEGS
ncbi:MAG: alpha-amylase/4-alpha-glucanotransferase domain-containing protein, partial [Candidatus Limnocylindrales bacterium]